MTMAVRDHPLVYVPSSLAPGSQFHSPISSPPPPSPLDATSPAALAPSDPKVSCARGARRPFSFTMPSPPAAASHTILVTGGAGYIGSHTVLQLLKGGFRVVVVDNLDNSSVIALERVRALTAEFGKNLFFHLVDLRDRQELEKVFSSTKFDAVIHFAGLKAVGESVKNPLLYYNNNIIGTINLLEVMATHGCKKLVFSSSATVYGWPKEVPCTEESPLCAMNPYGRTKLMTENICRDMCQSDSEWDMILLRYFNPVGAHPSGKIGEDPQGIPNNLMPFVQQVAVGRRPYLTVFGTDYGTKDGTGVRDYIHVVDLAEGHIAALEKLFEGSCSGCELYNLGTGRGTSVLEMVAAFEKASGKKIPLIMAGRRPGDSGIVYASTSKAEKELHWRARYGIEEMCRDQWNWASKNPWGYGSSEPMHAKHPTSESVETANGKHFSNGSLETANLKCHTCRSPPEIFYVKHSAYGSPKAANGKHSAYGSPRAANGHQHANGLTEIDKVNCSTNGFSDADNGKHHARTFLDAANVKHTVCVSSEAAANGKHPTYGLPQIANGNHLTSQQHQFVST